MNQKLSVNLHADGEKTALQVTVTGPAVRYAPLAKLSSKEQPIVPVPNRCPVVLVLVDANLSPTRQDLDLISAVSQATGRCAVGLVSCSSEDVSATEGFKVWRKFVPAEIPIGGVDARMGATLNLLADGPARAHGRAALMMRIQLIEGQLQRETEKRRKLSNQREYQTKLKLNQLVSDVITALDVTPPPKNAEQLSTVGRNTARELSHQVFEETGLNCDLPVPNPGAPPKATLLLDVLLSAVFLGAAVGVGKLLSQPLQWIGVGADTSNAVAMVAGCLLAVVIGVASIRRKAEERRRSWVVAYLANMRKTWERVLLEAVMNSGDTQPEYRKASGWRQRSLRQQLQQHQR